MSRIKVPDTFVIIFSVIVLAAAATWFVPGAEPQTWQIFSALYKGFVQQAGIIAFVLVVGGAFWVVNSTKALDEGIMKFMTAAAALEKYPLVRKTGTGNIVIVLVMLLFGVFGAVFGMSEETIVFVAVSIPLAKSLGYDEFVGVCMVYVAAHVGFAGAMLNPFTIGIAQDMAGLPLFSGIEYRTLCWILLMSVAVAFVLWYASKVKKPVQVSHLRDTLSEPSRKAGASAWICFVSISAALILFSVQYASECEIRLGQSVFNLPWLLWGATSLFIISGLVALRNSARMFILSLLMFTVVFLIIGVMGYGWYLPEICALFMALAVSAGFSAGYSADRVSKEFVTGAKDIFSAALIIGLAAGIIVILQDGKVVDFMLSSLASAFGRSGRAGALAGMYGVQTLINLFIPSASAKAAVTMPIMAPFSDLIGLSRQATVLAFQFGDGFTNMITPCSGVLLAVLSVAGIPYSEWVRFIWKFILVLVVAGFLLLLPTLLFSLPGF